MIGVSLSVKACRQFNLDISDVMRWAINDLDIKRFRLMSYWDEHEAMRGAYDFSELQQQLNLAAELGAEVSLCLGLRQPRWPETHRPDWAVKLSRTETEVAICNFITATLEVAEKYDCITSYQLENEALNKGIGHGHDFSRRRLRREMRLVKSKTNKSIIMSLTNSWGLPIIGPIPDQWAVSIYPYQWTKKGRSDSPIKPWMVRLRVKIISLIWRRPVFCHELQMEPWGPCGTEQLDLATQIDLMNPAIMADNLKFTERCGFDIIDLWGLEWWRATSNTSPDFNHKLIAGLRRRYQETT